MFWGVFKDKFDNTVTVTKALTVALIFSAGLNFFLGWVIVLLHNSERTIVTPPQITKPYWVTGNKYSPSYAESMGDYLSQVLLNVTPKSYVRALNAFMVYVSPKEYSDMNNSLYSQLKDMAALNVSQVFIPIKTRISKNGKDIIIRGQLTRISGGEKALSHSRFVIIGFKVVNGRFWITSVKVSAKLNNKSK